MGDPVTLVRQPPDQLPGGASREFEPEPGVAASLRLDPDMGGAGLPGEEQGPTQGLGPVARERVGETPASQKGRCAWDAVAPDLKNSP